MLASIFGRKIIKSVPEKSLIRASTSISTASYRKPVYGTKEYYVALADSIPSPKDLKNNPHKIAVHALDDIFKHTAFLDPLDVSYPYHLKALRLDCFTDFEYFKQLVKKGFDSTESLRVVAYGIIGYEAILEKSNDPVVRNEAGNNLADMKCYLEKTVPVKNEKLKEYVAWINELLHKYGFISEKSDTPSPLV